MVYQVVHGRVHRGGPWTGSTGVVHGLGPQGWSMDPAGSCFVYVHLCHVCKMGAHMYFRTVVFPLPYLPVYWSIPCISRPPIFEAKN